MNASGYNLVKIHNDDYNDNDNDYNDYDDNNDDVDDNNDNDDQDDEKKTADEKPKLISNPRKRKAGLGELVGLFTFLHF